MSHRRSDYQVWVDPRQKELQTNLAANVRRLRLEQGLSQQELAKESEIHLSQLQRLEAADVNTSLAILARLASALGIHASTLLLPAELPRKKKLGRPFGT